MSERQDTLQQYVSDMLAVERHILEAVERQAEDESTKVQTDAALLINRIKSTLQGHIRPLEQQLAALDGDEASPVKEAVTSVLGTAAGLLDKVRTNTVSKMLRDDYTALSLAAISYTMLHTTGLALQDLATADLATRHLKDITPLIIEISEVIPLVVTRELADDAEAVDPTVGPEATRNTQKAWEPENAQ